MGFDTVEPSSRVIRAFRRLGYKLGEAVADIVDNSIDAQAKRVLVRFVYTPRDVARVVIADTGSGMSPSTLKSAMRFGAKVNHPETHLGKYGMGLKTASFSQCRCLSVITRHGKTVSARRWTERDINRGWACARLDGGASARLLVESWGPLRHIEHGTLVIWDDLDRLEPRSDSVEQYVAAKMRGLKTHLGIVFHRLLKQRRVRIWLDRQLLGREETDLQFEVEPIDPFGYREPGNRHYPVVFRAHLGRMGALGMNAHIWPPAASGPAYSLGGKAAAHQGFYFYRNNRLIQAGGWNGLRKQDDEPHLTLARVAVDLPPRLDNDFALSTQKSGIDVPDTFLKAVPEARAGNTTWQDFVRDAQAAYRREPELRLPVIPGRGFPAKVRAKARHLLGKARRKGCTPFALTWKPLDPGVFFEIDRSAQAILVNADYKRRLNGGGGRAAGLFTTMLFVLLHDDLQSKMTAKKVEWLARCNQLLAAAYRSA